jgi:RNA ligase (TIGR02306 family)
MRDATIEIVENVRPHSNAERLDICNILGFQCVVQKGLYQGGEKIVYVRPDSQLPQEPWAEDYRKYSPNRIKNIKLRGYFSEGIIVPLDILPVDLSESLIGDDVSDLIGVKHYEPPTPQELNAKGGLPFSIPKTDETRASDIINKLPYGELVDVTLKVDGQSCSYYVNIDTPTFEPIFGVLGRNLEIKDDSQNNYTANVDRYDIKRKLTEYCLKEGVSLCIRGESYGQGIQGMEANPHSKMQKGWVMFSVYLVREMRYARKGDKYYFINVAKELGLPHVEIVESDVELNRELIEKYSTGIKNLDGYLFEGVVINHSKDSFKVINKYYDSIK